MEIITRKQAKELGLTRYFTGNPCIHGHISEKMTSTATCKKCMEIYVQKNKEKIKLKRHLKHKENRLEVNRKNLIYRINNREKINNRSKEYVRLNKEKIKESRRLYYIQNNERIRSRIKTWVQNNRDKVRISSSRKKAKRRGCLVGTFYKKEIELMIVNQKYKCINCKTSIKEKYHIDHIIPISLGGSNYISNIQILCPPCNLKKNAKDPIVWAQENGRLL